MRRNFAALPGRLGNGSDRLRDRLRLRLRLGLLLEPDGPAAAPGLPRGIRASGRPSRRSVRLWPPPASASRCSSRNTSPSRRPRSPPGSRSLRRRFALAAVESPAPDPHHARRGALALAEAGAAREHEAGLVPGLRPPGLDVVRADLAFRRCALGARRARGMAAFWIVARPKLVFEPRRWIPFLVAPWVSPCSRRPWAASGWSATAARCTSRRWRPESFSRVTRAAGQGAPLCFGDARARRARAPQRAHLDPQPRAAGLRALTARIEPESDILNVVPPLGTPAPSSAGTRSVRRPAG